MHSLEFTIVAESQSENTVVSCDACGDLKTSENFKVSLKTCLQIVGTILWVVCEVARITDNQVDG